MNCYFTDAYNYTHTSGFAAKVNPVSKIIYLHLKDKKNRDLGAKPELPVYFPWVVFEVFHKVLIALTVNADVFRSIRLYLFTVLDSLLFFLLI